MPETFRVNLFRKISPKREQADAGEGSVKFGESSVKFGEKELNDTQSKIVLMIKQNRGISASVMADKLSLSVRAIEKNIRELRDLGILIRHGAARGGYWEISEKVTL